LYEQLVHYETHCEPDMKRELIKFINLKKKKNEYLFEKKKNFEEQVKRTQINQKSIYIMQKLIAKMLVRELEKLQNDEVGLLFTGWLHDIIELMRWIKKFESKLKKNRLKSENLHHENLKDLLEIIS